MLNKKFKQHGLANLGHVPSEFAQVHQNDRVDAAVSKLREKESVGAFEVNYKDTLLREYAEHLQKKMREEAEEDLAQSMRNESEKMTLTPYHLPNVFKNKAHFDWYDFARAQRAAGHNIDPAIEHVQKKLFVPYRGHKSEREDIEECIKSLQNYLENLND